MRKAKGGRKVNVECKQGSRFRNDSSHYLQLAIIADI